MYATFLKAQQTSPTLVLTHVALGDEGAMEIAHFLAESEHLRCLDLAGNAISSTGLLHLARALKVNRTLESLILRHNKLLEDSEVGFVTLCRAISNHATLRHLDLRHNRLSGDLVARCIGELLQANKRLTHLELSWNPLGASAQLLQDYVTMNTTLLDCQLTGCQVPQETLLSIAQLLQRNRMACGAGMEAGPYRGEWHSSAGGSAPSTASGERTTRALKEPPSPLKSGGAVALGINAPSKSSLVVSHRQTEEFIDRILVWRLAHREKAPADGSFDHSQQLIDCLDSLQKELDRQRQAGDDEQNKTKGLIQGFKDREERYRNDVDAAQAKLASLALEHKELRAVAAQKSEQLGCLREACYEAKKSHGRSLQSDRQRYEAEEAKSKNDLATVTSECKVLADVLSDLEDRAAKQEQENVQLRIRTQELRVGVTVVDSW